MMRHRVAACLLLCALSVPAHAAEPDCFEALARTRNFTLGLPRHVLPLPDGRHVLYLRSGPRDTQLRLFAYDLAEKTERELAAPATSETLSAEEKARRERARMTLSGITDFAVSDDGGRVLAVQADRLLSITLPQGIVTPVPGSDWIAPRLSPDGSAVAAVLGHDVHIVDLASGRDTPVTGGGTATLTHGLAEFAAAEEFGREDGTWWSPDSRRLLFEEADMSGVEQHFINDPTHPETPPTAFRYPRAGTQNARTRLGMIGREGGPVTWITLDGKAWPYVARVIWPKHGPLTLVVLDRAQTHEAVLAVDTRTGATHGLLTESDPAWLDLTPRDDVAGVKLPAWLPDGTGFLWAAERGATWQLELHHADGTLDHAVTPAGWRFAALNDFLGHASGRVVVTGSPDRLSLGIYGVPLAGGAPTPLADAAGNHTAVFSENDHTLFADSQSLADGQRGTVLRNAAGRAVGTLPSQAEIPPHLPAVQYLTIGSRTLDAQLVRPADFGPGQHLPVILAVYAGPTVKLVQRAPLLSLEDQCLADHGFVVVSLDARGTPGRDHDFERATRGNLIDLPLADQVDGLQALGRRFAEMDLRRVGIEGWSFGGYFTAMATLRQPGVFAAGVAGAPVIDWADYDTAYTERYLGTPQSDPEAYRASNVLTYAASLQRPLLIMHGLTDDNVYFENTVKLTQALLAAGKPYRLLLLPGTHLLPDPLLRTRVDEARARFFQETLGVSDNK